MARILISKTETAFLRANARYDELINEAHSLNKSDDTLTIQRAYNKAQELFSELTRSAQRRLVKTGQGVGYVA